MIDILLTMFQVTVGMKFLFLIFRNSFESSVSFA